MLKLPEILMEAECYPLIREIIFSAVLDAAV